MHCIVSCFPFSYECVHSADMFPRETACFLLFLLFFKKPPDKRKSKGPRKIGGGEDIVILFRAKPIYKIEHLIRTNRTGNVQKCFFFLKF